MRKIDWESPLSREDVEWLRQAGIPGMEERIQAHQEQFGEKVPEEDVPEDTITQSGLDPQGQTRGVPAPTGDGPMEVSPDADAADADEEDDYDSWKTAELSAEVDNRNVLAESREDITPVLVEGTGTNGSVKKADLVKALRLWDQENPGAI